MASGPDTADQIKELQCKIQLLDGERTACYESTEATIKKNKVSIQHLRQENKRLRKNLAQANAHDEHLIRVAFQHRDWERNAYRNKSVKEVLEILDEGVLSKRKSLNALRHRTETYQRRLEELKMEYQRIKSERSCSDVSTDALTLKFEEDAMNLRALENNLEKTQFKCREAENIMINYHKCKTHLQNESLTYRGQLDILEAEILKHREELRVLQAMNNDDLLSKEHAKAQLQHQEEMLYKECKERERMIAGYKIKVKEHRAQADKGDKKVQRTVVQPDEPNSEAQHSTAKTEDEEKKISTLEEAFKRIKDATGVTHVQEIVERFNSQKETYQQLKKLKEENGEVLLQLKEQKEFLGREFEEMKYSREAKLSSDQQALRECEQQLQAQKQRCDTAKEQLGWLLKILSTARAVIEHLADRLQHISLSEDTVLEVDPDSDQFVLELMTQCEKKLESLYKELQGQDLAAIMKEIEKEELYNRSEEKLEVYNAIDEPPEDQAHDPFHDESETDKEDVGDVISREALKRQSQLIVDSNSKRKSWSKKKKSKS